MSTFEVIRGVEGCCLALDDTRIAGPKPWGGGTVIHKWETAEEYGVVNDNISADGRIRNDINLPEYGNIEYWQERYKNLSMAYDRLKKQYDTLVKDKLNESYGYKTRDNY